MDGRFLPTADLKHQLASLSQLSLLYAGEKSALGTTNTQRERTPEAPASSRPGVDVQLGLAEVLGGLARRFADSAGPLVNNQVAMLLVGSVLEVVVDSALDIFSPKLLLYEMYIPTTVVHM